MARSLPFKLTRSVGSIVALIPFSGVSRLSTSILVLYWSILLILSVILVLMILILSRLVLVLDSPIPILRSVIMILYCRLILILWSSIPILYSCISILCRFIIALCRLISILWVSVLILYNPIPILHSLRDLYSDKPHVCQQQQLRQGELRESVVDESCIHCEMVCGKDGRVVRQALEQRPLE